MGIWAWVGIGLAAAAVGWMGLALPYGLVKSAFFGRRTDENVNPVCLAYEDIRGDVDRIPYVLTGKKSLYGDSIEGYVYLPKGRVRPKALILLSPGYGNTHLQYLLDIAFLAGLGYAVLAYDQYGTGMSGGKTQREMAQGEKTLEKVLADVKTRHLNQGLPILLYGHSWGGWCVLKVGANHREIQKVIARAPVKNPLTGPLGAFSNRHGKGWVPVFGISSVFASPLRYLKGYGHSVGRALKRNPTTRFLLTRNEADPMVPYSSSPNAWLDRHPLPNVSLFVAKSRSIHNDLLGDEAYQAYKKAHKRWEKLATGSESESLGQQKAFLSRLDRKAMLTLDPQTAHAIEAFLND